MHSTLTTSYMALQAERDTLDTRAHRGSLAEEAAKSASRQPLALTTRRSAGTILIALGQRLQGAPAPVPADLAMKTGH